MRIRRVVSHAFRPVSSPPEASRFTSNPPIRSPIITVVVKVYFVSCFSKLVQAFYCMAVQFSNSIIELARTIYIRCINDIFSSDFFVYNHIRHIMITIIYGSGQPYSITTITLHFCLISFSITHLQFGSVRCVEADVRPVWMAVRCLCCCCCCCCYYCLSCCKSFWLSSRHCCWCLCY